MQSGAVEWIVCFQLRVSTELHSTRSVGNRLRHFWRTDPTDDPAEQVAGTGAAWRPAWRLVSASRCCVVRTARTDLFWNRSIQRYYRKTFVKQLPSVLWRCWLGSRKVIRAVRKLSRGVLAWLSVCGEVQICIWSSWCHCHSLSLASAKSRLVLPSWYPLTWVVPAKGPLNGCCCCCCCQFTVWFDDCMRMTLGK